MILRPFSWQRPTPRDPLSIGIALISAAEAVTGIAIGFESAALVGSISLAVVATGANYALNRLLAPGTPQTPLNTPEVRGNIRQSAPAQRIIYGKTRAGGAVFFLDTDTPPYLYLGLLLSARRISGIDALYLGSNKLIFSSLPNNTIVSPLAIDGQFYISGATSRLSMCLRDGDPDQATDALIAANFTNISLGLFPSATPLGDMPDFGGVTAAFDGTVNTSAGKTGTGSLTGYLGQDWGAGVTRTVTRFRVLPHQGAHEQPFSSSSDRSVSFELQGSADNFVTPISLCTIPAAIYTSDGLDVDSGITTTTAYRYHRIIMTEANGDAGSHTIRIGEVEFHGTAGEFRQRGIATATFQFNYGTDTNDFQRTWGQVPIPSPLFDIRGATIYDPRDPTQDRDDDTTWKYSDNAALVQADWLRQEYGVNFPVDRIDFDKVGTAANFDDELIGNADGTLSKRHTIDGVVQLNQRPSQVMEGLLSANRGFMVQSKGKGWIASSSPRDPVLTVDESLIVGGFELRDDRAKRDTVNIVRTRFASSDRDYQEIDGPVLTRSDLVTADDEQLDITIELPFTSDQRAAQRLAKQYLLESRLPRAMTVVVKLTRRTLELDLGDCVQVSLSAPFTRANTTYTVEDYAMLADFSGIQLALAEYDQTIANDWTPETDEQPFALPDVDLS